MTTRRLTVIMAADIVSSQQEEALAQVSPMSSARTLRSPCARVYDPSATMPLQKTFPGERAPRSSSGLAPADELRHPVVRGRDGSEVDRMVPRSRMPLVGPSPTFLEWTGGALAFSGDCLRSPLPDKISVQTVCAPGILPWLMFRPSGIRPVGKFEPSGRNCDQLRPPYWIGYRFGERQALFGMLSIQLRSAHLIDSNSVGMPLAREPSPKCGLPEPWRVVEAPSPMQRGLPTSSIRSVTSLRRVVPRVSAGQGFAVKGCG
ncbi:hypothetical protein SAMN05444161_6817 [Rhizobiales bacterium GAS191]|nr:hypothetical protein SAMN05444161_6817 [Rhizobiales bacterium GAS191]